MNDALLDAAVTAARNQADAAACDGVATRLRIRETLATRRGQRRRRFTIVAAVLATMFGSTAFAYYADWQVPWHRAPHVEAPPTPAAAVRVEVAGDEPAVRARVAARDTIAPRAVEATAPLAVAPRPAVPAAPAHVSEPAHDPELAAYRVAHRTHFSGGSPAAALAAWDAYLAAYPHGALSIDARFSRALILIKLERWADARAALQPFADAPAGSYRQADAAKLLAALPR